MDDTGHSGFTLIELLICVTLVALLAGLAIPAMGQFIDRHRLRGAGEALVQELRYARQYAVINQVTTHFSLANDTPSGWCYAWRAAEPCDCSASENSCTSAASRPISQLHTARDYPSIRLSLNNSTGRRQLQFSAIRGTATAASMSLQNSAGELQVIVSPLGRVRRCGTGLPGVGSC